MTNQELVTAGRQTMDETDQAIERTKKVKTTEQFQAYICFLLLLLPAFNSLILPLGCGKYY